VVWGIESPNLALIQELTYSTTIDFTGFTVEQQQQG
jgi:hypothetical protein